MVNDGPRGSLPVFYAKLKRGDIVTVFNYIRNDIQERIDYHCIDTDANAPICFWQKVVTTFGNPHTVTTTKNMDLLG